MDDLGGLILHLCVDSCVGMYKAENGHEIQVYKVNRRLVIFRE